MVLEEGWWSTLKLPSSNSAISFLSAASIAYNATAFQKGGGAALQTSPYLTPIPSFQLDHMIEQSNLVSGVNQVATASLGYTKLGAASSAD